MPRKLINDYVFYKFVCNDENIECCYVGSTANFNDRKRHHYNMCNNPNDKRYNYKIYKTIRENGGWENWKIVIIGEAKEISLTQSRILEQNYIDELKANMNMCRAYRTKEDVAECNKKKYEKKKEIYKAKARAYYDANKEKLNEQKKEYREINKEKQKEYVKANKDKISEWRRLNYLKKKNEKKV